MTHGQTIQPICPFSSISLIPRSQTDRTLLAEFLHSEILGSPCTQVRGLGRTKSTLSLLKLICTYWLPMAHISPLVSDFQLMFLRSSQRGYRALVNHMPQANCDPLKTESDAWIVLHAFTTWDCIIRYTLLLYLEQLAALWDPCPSLDFHWRLRLWLSLDCSDEAECTTKQIEMCSMGIGWTKFCDPTYSCKPSIIRNLGIESSAPSSINSWFISIPLQTASLRCLVSPICRLKPYTEHIANLYSKIASETPPAMHLGSETSGGHFIAEAKENTSLVVSLENLNLESDQSPEFVDTEAKIASLVGRLQNLPISPPSLYIDLEGVDLSRNGSISILQIHILPLRKRIWSIYIVSRRKPS